MKICSVEGCGRKHNAKGLCKSCSDRARRAANPDEVRAYERRQYEKYQEKKKAAARDRRVRDLASDPVRVRASERGRALKKNYGITSEQYEQMAEAQGHRCLICGQVKFLHVDHKHDASRKVRGLLCVNCNTKVDWADLHLAAILAHIARGY